MKDFLTDEECDSIIAIAQQNGLKASNTVKTLKHRVSREDIMEHFYNLDLDDDGILQKYEVFGWINCSIAKSQIKYQ